MDSYELTRKLTSLKEEISGLEREKATLEGQMKQVMEQLEKEFGVKSIEEAEKKLAALDDEISKIEKNIIDGIKEIENELGAN